MPVAIAPGKFVGVFLDVGAADASVHAFDSALQMAPNIFDVLGRAVRRIVLVLPVVSPTTLIPHFRKLLRREATYLDGLAP